MNSLPDFTPELATEELPLEEARVSIKEKWQGAVTESSGFVAVPLALLRLQSTYGLNSTEMLVLINLLAHWWEPKNPVYPRSSTIAKRMGVDLRTIQRATQSLVRRGLLGRSTLPDGKRIFTFDSLLKRVKQDMPLAVSGQLRETFGS